LLNLILHKVIFRLNKQQTTLTTHKMQLKQTNSIVGQHIDPQPTPPMSQIEIIGTHKGLMPTITTQTCHNCMDVINSLNQEFDTAQDQLISLQNELYKSRMDNVVGQLTTKFKSIKLVDEFWYHLDSDSQVRGRVGEAEWYHLGHDEVFGLDSNPPRGVYMHEPGRPEFYIDSDVGRSEGCSILDPWGKMELGLGEYTQEDYNKAIAWVEYIQGGEVEDWQMDGDGLY